MVYSSYRKNKRALQDSQEISGYELTLKHAKTMEHLELAFLAIPNSRRKTFIDLKDRMKEKFILKAHSKELDAADIIACPVCRAPTKKGERAVDPIGRGVVCLKCRDAGKEVLNNTKKGA